VQRVMGEQEVLIGRVMVPRTEAADLSGPGFAPAIGNSRESACGPARRNKTRRMFFLSLMLARLNLKRC
jgi:hypothetical protein